MGTINYKNPTLAATLLNNGTLLATDKQKIENIYTAIDGYAPTIYVDESILAETNRAIAEENLIKSVLDGYSGSSSTDGYATVIYVDESILAETNRAIAEENLIKSVLDGYIGSSSTDGYATVIYVDEAILAETNRAIAEENLIKSVLDGYSGGEPISVPWATDTTGGMITDAMAVKFAALPSDSQSAAQVLATLSSSAVRTYYETNWSRQAWYLDAVNGDDSATGYEEAHPLQTTEELTARLAVPVPIDHPVTVYVAQGSYGTLAVRVIQTALACPFDVVGAVAHTSIGTVTSYANATVATNTDPRLVASAVTDWTDHRGKRVDVLDGASSGAVAWVGKVSAGALGADVAGVSQFAKTQASPLAPPGGAVPASGSAVSVATLPTFEHLAITQRGPAYLPASTFDEARGVGVFSLDVGTLSVEASGAAHVDGCSVGSIRNLSASASPPLVFQRSRFRGRQTAENLSRVQLLNVLALSGGATTSLLLTDLAACYFSISYGIKLQVENVAMLSVGVFDCTGASTDAVTVLSLHGRKANVGSVYGSGNGRAGVSVPVAGTVIGSSNAVTGASGDVRINTTIVPWTALPWVDGERSGEATLAVPGTGHDAESTSYVDVTVPYVLATQKITACAKTFGGTPGLVSAVRIDATTIRVVSSSAADTSVVTWHILPVGDNAVIRS